MKLTVLDIAVLIDTIAGTLQIEDGGRNWKYSSESRKELMDKIIYQAHSTQVDITDDEVRMEK